MKTLFIPFLMAVMITAACSSKSNQKRLSSSIDAKVDSVLRLMTLDEKIGQLTLYTSDMDQTGAFIRKEYEEDIKKGEVGSIFNAYGAEYTRKLQKMAVENTRLGIPLLFGYDVIHGHRTIFPVPLAEAASWDIPMIERTARIAAEEAAAEGLHWTFAPMADVSRDPRWGRIVEGSGEDPYLGSVIAAARVKGFQGVDLTANNTIAACVKHFAAYGASLAGRDYHSVDMSDRMLREVYLPPYKAAVDAGALTVMTAFNDLNGIPATANSYLFQDILRDEWGFEGFVVTDYTAIMELINHGVAKDKYEASEKAIKVGIDMSMQDGFYQQTLAELVSKNIVSESLVDKAVANVLKVKFQLGLFEDPYLYSNTEREATIVMSDEFLADARKMAQRSMVLLKNEDNTLPLSKSSQKIAVIGPFATNKRDLIGSWSAAGDWAKSVSLVEGIKAKVPSAQVLVAEGTSIDGTDKSGFAQAIETAKKADTIILALGEAYWMSGEAASRSNLDLPGMQQQLADAIIALGKPVTVVLFNGRPLTIEKLDQDATAILEAWFPGTQSGHAVADILFGDYNPSAKLPITFPRNVGQIPIYYSQKHTGRPFDAANKYTTKYLDVPNEPLYPFGYGLSYSNFVYGELALSKTAMSEDDYIDVSVNILNNSTFDGEEIVQLYISDKVASVARSVKDLVGFKKILIKAGEETKVTFKIDKSHLSFYRADMTFGPEKGAYELQIGSSSDNTKNALINLE
jgi:beta-glucosidase